MKITVHAVLLIFVVCASSAQEKNDLQGKIFSVKLEIEGPSRPGMKWVTDELTFKDWKLFSKVMGEKENFPPFYCTIKTDVSSPGEVHFTASGKNNAVSEIVWEGTVKGDQIEGTAVWTNANGPQTQRFSGMLKGRIYIGTPKK